ncbi:xylulokinase [Flavihumibacter petaseus]|uniref:Xylulose kinase n=1 Tax=Flavihumibacter petaseus NBRC 106054 TaxID=1220578 RepID=A0A0E9MVM9_9BACT|nr:FGGY family carbohydrate kinase [Flavihumibacter petaseus]GAO41639.1 xylulose kinase [Flavihumibacter petaseus NBRC 106054]
MLLLGIDIGTSSVKVSIVDGDTQRCIAASQYPDTEAPIESAHPGWAEQAPADWWDRWVQAFRRAVAKGGFQPADIGAIGIAYQMHGLVITDREGAVLRPSIIWCDSRAVAIGEQANEALGPGFCLEHYLNAPGNFTASKLAWVKQHEREIFDRTAHVMLPGDYIAFRLTGQLTSSPSSLSEGVFWDFKKHGPATDLMEYYGFDTALLAKVQPVFSEHGRLDARVAAGLQLRPGIPVSYKAGDQPNNALSLGVTEPGEVAATAGTSGVIYAVSDALTYDPQSRVNTFAHVNHLPEQIRTGVLLCINGTGILYGWARQQWAAGVPYNDLNAMAASVAPGSEGIRVLPFGNGAERMLGNRLTGVQLHHIDLNHHRQAHLFRAIQEGIAFAFRYGLDIMRSNKVEPLQIRAGRSNLFQSEVFLKSFVAATGVPVTLYPADGSVGAALGAGIGCGYYPGIKDAFIHQQAIRTCTPDDAGNLETPYQEWLALLQKQL